MQLLVCYMVSDHQSLSLFRSSYYLVSTFFFSIGTSGALLSLCVYVFDGEPNLCANSSNITFFAWNFKIIFAIITDSFRPFGLRRRPWMMAGWIGVLVILLVLACSAHTLNTSSWLGLLLVLQW